MDLRRLRAGEWIAAIGGVVLILSLFLSWHAGSSGWNSLAVADLVLALIGAIAIAVLVVTAAQPVPALPIALDALTSLAGLIGLILVLAHFRGDTGFWVALAGAAAISLGGSMAMRDERLSPPGKTTDLTGRPAPPPPEPRLIPPPRPGAPG